MTKKIDLDSDLLSILLTESFNDFTVLELRSAYIAIVNNPMLGKIEARKFVYRHILRLEKKGLLERKYSEKRDRTFYSKTEQFSLDKFQTSENHQESSMPQVEAAVSEEVNKGLVERLQRYNAELPSLIGEASEYKSLHAEYPQLKGLQKNYNLARNKIRNIEGLITAVETTIKDQKVLEENNDAS